jgi:DNA replication and repair protein RecF
VLITAAVFEDVPSQLAAHVVRIRAGRILGPDDKNADDKNPDATDTDETDPEQTDAGGPVAAPTGVAE